MADKVARAMAYLDRLPVAVSGAGGHNATLRAACECFRFGLSDSEAAAAMEWYNANRCQPKWSTHELKHKIASAATIVTKGGQVAKHLGNGRRGYQPQAARRTFVAPTAPSRRVQVKPVPVCQQSEAAEEAWWANVADGLGMTLEDYDIICGAEPA